ncbi:alanine racemase [Psychrosphaera haliotis]|uniref:alanine racemase n=1 Tax=Psychrosphaera haliotis TaxID=555083 RepID=UPI0031CE82C6
MKIAVAEINLEALQHNLLVVKRNAPNSKILAMLKANAYGHGTTEIAKSLHQADAFGVARLSEAVALRAAGITKPIVLLEGFFEADELQIISNLGLDTVLHTEQQFDDFMAADIPRSVRVWLKVDTGMHRLGLPPETFPAIREKISRHKNILGEPILMSHFGCADDVTHSLNDYQFSVFEELQNHHKGECSFANSAAILSFKNSHHQWVRPGIMLYGVSPVNNTSASDYELKPVMTLKSSIIAIREVKKGQSVGYGATWVAKEDTRLAVIAIGYGDGYPRNAENGTPILVNGVKYPLSGRVSMDMISIDIGNEKTIKVGDEAILWGENLPLETIADYAKTVPYELLCGVTGRVEKRFSRVQNEFNNRS